MGARVNTPGGGPYMKRLLVILVALTFLTGFVGLTDGLAQTPPAKSEAKPAAKPAADAKKDMGKHEPVDLNTASASQATAALRSRACVPCPSSSGQ